MMQWSQPVQDMFNILSVFTFNVDLTSPECFNPSIDYFYKAKIVMIIPPIFFGVLLIVAILRTAPFNYPFILLFKCFKKMTFKQPSFAQFTKHLWVSLAAFHVLLQIMFVALCSWVLGYFSCVPFGSKLVMTKSPANECYTGQHLEYLPLFSLGIIVYVIGIPLYFLVLFQFRKSSFAFLRLYSEKVLFARNSDFVESGQIIIVIALKVKACMIAVATFLNQIPVLQAIMVSMLCFVYMSFLIHLKPYKKSKHTIVDMCCHIGSIVTLNCGVLFYVLMTTSLEKTYQPLLTYIVISTTVLILLLVFYQVIRDFKQANVEFKLQKLEKINRKLASEKERERQLLKEEIRREMMEEKKKDDPTRKSKEEKVKDDLEKNITVIKTQEILDTDLKKESALLEQKVQTITTELENKGLSSLNPKTDEPGYSIVKSRDASNAEKRRQTSLDNIPAEQFIDVTNRKISDAEMKRY